MAELLAIGVTDEPAPTGPSPDLSVPETSAPGLASRMIEEGVASEAVVLSTDRMTELYLVADNGVLSCLDAKTGTVHYQERCTGPISASILHADGRLYLQDEKGLGVVIKPGKTFEILAKNDLAERSLASYAVVGDDLLIRTESSLWRVGSKGSHGISFHLFSL